MRQLTIFECANISGAYEINAWVRLGSGTALSILYAHCFQIFANHRKCTLGTVVAGQIGFIAGAFIVPDLLKHIYHSAQNIAEKLELK